MSNTQIALLGCNALTREGLRRILEEMEFEIVQSSDKPGCLLDIDLSESDDTLIVLVDQSSPEYYQDEMRPIMDRIPSAKLVYLAEKFDLDDMISAFKSGAQGYIVKDIRCESLIGSLRLIALGEKVLPGELIEQLPKGLHSNGAAAWAQNDLYKSLTAREIEILRYLVVGFPNKVIARRLDLSEATVKVHVKGILRKLNVSNRTQAAVLAFNSGLGLTHEEPEEGGAVAPDDMRDGGTANGQGANAWPQLVNVA
jgi:two-component system, NarL family, nitrate/nitrite response regulator NarL